MGLFAFAEIVVNLGSPDEHRELYTSKVSGLMPTLADFKAALPSILRGTTIGSALGVLPGSGQTISSFMAYMIEKRFMKDPSRLGKGAIEGVAAPESANNAAAQTAFIPTLTLGIPGSPVMALILGALIIHGINPGPQVMTHHPALFWGLVVSMWLGNILLVLLNLPLIGIWVWMLRVPYRWLYPAILVFSCVGIYTINNNAEDVFLAALFGLLGYVLVKLACEPAPFILGFVLGPIMEVSLRRSLLLSFGDPSIFITRPISAAFLIIAAGVLVMVLLPSLSRKKDVALRG
jgi:TctA family transporter